MKKILQEDTKYEAFSLVEMLITIAIIGIVMLIASTTLTTLIKVSSVSSYKTTVRNETEFVLELVRRTIRNSNPADVYVYDSLDVRTYDPEANAIIDEGFAEEIETIYSEGLLENEVGNEIHFRPYGFDSWVCIGFFASSVDSEFGYVLKTSAQDLWGQQQTCFENTQDYDKYTIVLNSDAVDINAFEISYLESSDGNYVFKFDIKAEPVEWYLAKDAPVSAEVFRQAVVTTGGLIW